MAMILQISNHEAVNLSILQIFNWDRVGVLLQCRMRFRYDAGCNAFTDVITKVLLFS